MSKLGAAKNFTSVDLEQLSIDAAESIIIGWVQPRLSSQLRAAERKTD